MSSRTPNRTRGTLHLLPEYPQYSGSESYSASKTKTRLAPKFGFGAEFDINDYISIRTEYEGIFKACKEGDSLSDVDYHLFTVGLKYWF